jgi:heptosyltransferase-2
MKEKLDLNVNEDPEIQINETSIIKSIEEFKINKNDMNLLLGIGGSGPTKRIPSSTILEVIEKISKIRKCKFFLATGKNNKEQIILNEILHSKFKNLCVPLDNLSIKEILPIIKNCNLSICNDSSFSHLSAALGVKTITLMADTPLVYGNYSTKMFPIIPDGEENVTHNTLGKEKINPQKIFDKIIEIIN